MSTLRELAGLTLGCAHSSLVQTAPDIDLSCWTYHAKPFPYMEKLTDSHRPDFRDCVFIT